VPDAFFELTEYFYHPVFNDGPAVKNVVVDAATFSAIEHCLWKWKTPLSREWYSYIFGLKHDLLPEDRINKTQNLPLAKVLLEVCDLK